MNIAEYYSRRASEYEEIYSKPERQSDLKEIERLLLADLRGRDILEIACGTGYWTERVAPIANSVVAYDISEETLQIARSKAQISKKVRCEIGNAFHLPACSVTFNGGLAGFWWSHVPRQESTQFLDGFFPHFSVGATICCFDNNYVEGSSSPISRKDQFGITHQSRALKSSGQTEVLKNFFTVAELREAFTRANVDCEMITLQYYWYARLKVR